MGYTASHTRKEKTLPAISNFERLSGRASAIISVGVIMNMLSSTEPGIEMMDCVICWLEYRVVNHCMQTFSFRRTSDGCKKSQFLEPPHTRRTMICKRMKTRIGGSANPTSEIRGNSGILRTSVPVFGGRMRVRMQNIGAENKKR